MFPYYREHFNVNKKTVLTKLKDRGALVLLKKYIKGVSINSAIKFQLNILK